MQLLSVSNDILESRIDGCGIGDIERQNVNAMGMDLLHIVQCFGGIGAPTRGKNDIPSVKQLSRELKAEPAIGPGDERVVCWHG